jgi:hypothetical protein
MGGVDPSSSQSVQAPDRHPTAPMILPILITAWFLIVAVVLAACRAAASAERVAVAAAKPVEPPSVPTARFRGLTVYEGSDPATLRRVSRALPQRTVADAPVATATLAVHAVGRTTPSHAQASAARRADCVVS